MSRSSRSRKRRSRRQRDRKQKQKKMQNSAAFTPASAAPIENSLQESFSVVLELEIEITNLEIKLVGIELVIKIREKEASLWGMQSAQISPGSSTTETTDSTARPEPSAPVPTQQHLQPRADTGCSSSDTGNVPHWHLESLLATIARCGGFGEGFSGSFVEWLARLMDSLGRGQLNRARSGGESAAGERHGHDPVERVEENIARFSEGHWYGELVSPLP